MAHTLILGIPESGKSTLGKKLAADYRHLGRQVAVLDSTGAKWPADFQTDSPELFLNYCRVHISLRVFVDESGDAFEHQRSDLNWLGNRGRHLGHACFFIGQGYPQVPLAVRRCCTCVYLFNCNPDDAKALAKYFNAPELESAPQLKKGEFLLKRSFEPVRLGKINFTKGTVEIAKRRRD